MSIPDDGGPAFPVIERTAPQSYGGVDSAVYLHRSEGMSLRAYFAGQAMQGMLAYPDNNGDSESIARAAVLFSDALIAELQKS